MSEAITIIQTVGFPIAAFVMVWRWATGEVTKRLDRIENKLDRHMEADKQ